VSRPSGSNPSNRADVAFATAAIPAGTVAWEEIAFRGVLAAALRRVLAEPAVTAVAAGTAAAGALLSVLRQRSGSLAAPVLVHLAANCTGPLAGALARSLDARANPPRTPPGPGRNAGRTRARSRAGR